MVTSCGSWYCINHLLLQLVSVPHDQLMVSYDQQMTYVNLDIGYHNQCMFSNNLRSIFLRLILVISKVALVILQFGLEHQAESLSIRIWDLLI